MANRLPAAVIVSLLADHHRLDAQSAAATDGGAFCPQDELTSRIMREIDLSCSDDVPTALADGSYSSWWEKFRAKATPREQIRAAYILLARIDHHFSNQSVVVEVLPNQACLVLGPKVWDKKTRRRFPRDNRNYFPNLRLSSIATIRYLGLNDHINIGAKRAGKKLKLRCHSLRKDTFACFAPTRSIDETTKTMGFRLTDLRRIPPSTAEGTGDYLDEVEQATREACHDGVNMLLFPELCITAEARRRIESALTASDANDLFLVLAGSSHVSSETGWRNTGAIYARRRQHVEVVAEFVKRERGSYRIGSFADHPGLKEVSAACGSSYQDIAEDIITNGPYTIFNTPIGLIAVIICKDAITGEAELHDLCRLVDHLVVLSMNAAEGYFGPKLKDLSALHRVACYYVNCQHSAVAPAVECAGMVVPSHAGGRGNSDFRYRSAPEGPTESQIVGPNGESDFQLELP